MNDSFPSRVSAARIRVVCLRVATFAIAALALGAVSAFAHERRHVRRETRRTPQKHRAVTHRRRPVACPGAHARIGHVARRDTEAATLCLLNLQRAHHGLPRLRASARLEVSAQSWTNTMVQDGAFSHSSDFGARISRSGFRWSEIGENIADGYRTPAGAVTAWMHSLGHCENILSPLFRNVGTGFDRASATNGWAAGTWTLDFGLLMGRRAPSRDWTPAEHCPD